MRRVNRATNIQQCGISKSYIDII